MGQITRPETPPSGATYSTKLACLLNNHPDLFEGLPWTPMGSDRLAGGNSDRGAHKCQDCGRSRGASGAGSMFCHACSGVDTMRLRDSILWAVMRRQALRRDLRLDEQEPEADEEESSGFGS